MADQTARPEPSARDWRTYAECRGTDPDLFFPTVDSGPVYERQVAAAKSFCADCTVVSECLSEALDRIPDGIAGGLTADERRCGGSPCSEADVELPASTRSENAAVGAALLATGRSPAAVARRCRVTERTVYRWKAVAAAQQGRAES